MKCPQCGSVYSDDNLFCLHDGHALIHEKAAQETLIGGPFAKTAASSDPICAACGLVNEPGVKFCKKCGASVNSAKAGSPPYPGFEVRIDPPPAPPPGRYDQGAAFTPPVYQAAPAPQPSIRGSSGYNAVMIGLLVVLTGLLVVLIILLLRSSQTQPDASRSVVNATDPTNKEPKPTQASNTSPTPPANTGPSNVVPKITTSDLPSSFDRSYSGFSDRPLTLNLHRDGDKLTGSADTPGDSDQLTGTIAPDGSFRLEGYNVKVNRVTGVWTGQITNSLVKGIWLATNGRRVTFSASR